MSSDAARSGGPALDRTRIVLRGLRVSTRVGWGEQERQVPQLLVLDLELELTPPPGPVAGPTPGPTPGPAAAAAPEDLELTVDYAELAGRVAGLVAGRTRRLLETVAGDVLTEVLRDGRVDAATVTVHKPAAPLPVDVDDVAVVRTRRRSPA